MKKLFLIFVLVFCIFSFNKYENLPFSLTPCYAEIATEQTINQNLDNKVEDILDKPVFQVEEQKTSKFNKITQKLSSLIIKIIGGVALLVVAIVCFSFILPVSRNRKIKNQRKKASEDSNVIDAVENFARHRIRK